MSETAIAVKDEERKVELRNEISKILGIEEMIDSLEDEFENSGMADLDPTVGNVITLVCRSVVRSMIGGEMFEIDLSELSDEEAKSTLTAAGEKIVSAAENWNDKITEVKAKYAEAHNDE